jgi:hypothetical protein
VALTQSVVATADPPRRSVAGATAADADSKRCLAQRQRAIADLAAFHAKLERHVRMMR